ncbi:MAG: hypothetical protein HY965_00185 [Ignavibacteriales bacterium]|nr:hypothetical protein [Ignavibacteriales bacterium]
MEKLPQEIFAEKANLIYEFDARSPLFVRKASMEIETQNLEYAVEILRNGIAVYPDYPVPYVLLGDALGLQGHYDEARSAYKTASDLIDSPESYYSFTQKLEQIKKLRSPFNIKKRNTFVEAGEWQTEESEKAQDNVQPLFEDRLHHIADQLSRAKIQIPEGETEIPARPVTEETTHNPLIISDTLAKIYLSQGKLTDAIYIYEMLIKKNPARSDEFARIISDLKKKLAAQQV